MVCWLCFLSVIRRGLRHIFLGCKHAPCCMILFYASLSHKMRKNIHIHTKYLPVYSIHVHPDYPSSLFHHLDEWKECSNIVFCMQRLKLADVLLNVPLKEPKTGHTLGVRHFAKTMLTLVPKHTECHGNACHGNVHSQCTLIWFKDCKACFLKKKATVLAIVSNTSL